MVWTKYQWNVFHCARRQPNLDLKREITMMEKDKANLKRDHKLEEAKLWWSLYDQKKILEKSLLKRFEASDIVGGQVELKVRDLRDEEEPPMPSEVTKDFVNFKVATSRKMTTRKKSVRPRYSDIYAMEHVPRENNMKNIKYLLEERREYMDMISKAPDIGTKVVRYMDIKEMVQREGKEGLESEGTTHLHMPAQGRRCKTDIGITRKYNHHDNGVKPYKGPIDITRKKRRKQRKEAHSKSSHDESGKGKNVVLPLSEEIDKLPLLMAHGMSQETDAVSDLCRYLTTL